MCNKHSRDGDAFPHHGFKARSDDAGVSQSKLRRGNTSSKNRERRGSVLTRKGLKGGVICFLKSFSQSMCCRRREVREEGEERGQGSREGGREEIERKEGKRWTHAS